MTLASISVRQKQENLATNICNDLCGVEKKKTSEDKEHKRKVVKDVVIYFEMPQREHIGGTD